MYGSTVFDSLSIGLIALVLYMWVLDSEPYFLRNRLDPTSNTLFVQELELRCRSMTAGM